MIQDAALFHLDPMALPAGASLVEGTRTILALRPSPELEASQGSFPASAAAWLAADPARLDPDVWFAVGLEQPDASPPVSVRTLWSYLPSGDEPVDVEAVSDAIAQFVATTHPELEGGAEVLRALIGSIGELAGLGGGVHEEEVDVLGVLGAVVEASGGEWSRFEEGEAIGFMIRGDVSTWVCVAEVSRAQAGTLLVLSSAFPSVVPTERRIEAYGAFGRWNAAQGLATLDLAPTSGRVSLRTPMFCEATPSALAMRRFLDVHIEAVEETWALVQTYATQPGDDLP
ncbi:MAG: hypothetical protein M0Z40_09415 [Actinomycetota bacterium]|nr:hypothetical protein [Actinomycetota bacterium]